MDCDYSYVITKSAKQDINEILDYITNQLCNVDAATKWHSHLHEKLKAICTFPSSAPKGDFSYNRAVGKIFVGNYTVFFEFSDTTVFVLRVQYSASNLKDLF